MTAAKRPEGTEDILQPEVATWTLLEARARAIFRRFGYEEVRPPVFEHTPLFQKATGETTDIVEKEMFTVPSRAGGESYTFRPELTPGALRLLIDSGRFADRKVNKVWYWGPAFRNERPQKGRLRQFTQFGVEAVGSDEPFIDVETVVLYAELLKEFGIARYELRVNTIGCATCRPVYREVLKQAVAADIQTWCENCRRRYERNVFRILDCKADAKKVEALPSVLDHVCADCKSHFEKVRAGLEGAGLAFSVDPRIVRGLDYYTRTVFEFTSPDLGSQSALAGGGRYDGLIEKMGGPKVNGIGWASSVERILIARDAAKAPPPPPDLPDFYLVAAGDEARPALFRLALELRRAGLAGDLDFEGRSLKAQFRSANRSGARFAVVVGAEELANGSANVKNMQSGEERKVPLAGVAKAISEGTKG